MSATAVTYYRSDYGWIFQEDKNNSITSFLFLTNKHEGQ